MKPFYIYYKLGFLALYYVLLYSSKFTGIEEIYDVLNYEALFGIIFGLFYVVLNCLSEILSNWHLILSITSLMYEASFSMIIFGFLTEVFYSLALLSENLSSSESLFY